jgi:uncharacterized RDD family membrane protein YckC
VWVSPDSTDNPADVSTSAAAASEPRVWHYVLDDSAYGPTTASDLREMASRGLIDRASLVWREGWTAWRTVGETDELRSVIARHSAEPPRAAGASGPDSPSPLPALTLNTDSRSTARLCLLRLAAALIDQCILLVPSCVTLSPVMFVLVARGMTPDRMMQLTPMDPEYWLLFFTVWITQWAYSSLTESSVLMGTVGKRVCGLRVTDLSGRRLGFGRASARYWSKLASFPLLIGYLLAAFTGGHRALHDLIAGTVVGSQRP